MDQKMKRNIRYGIFALLFIYVSFLFKRMPLSFDYDYWCVWSSYIYFHGLGHVYDSGANYLPLYHYILWFYAQLAGSWEGIIHNLNYLRIFTYLFDIAGLWFVYKWIDRKFDFLLLLLFNLLNIAYVYNTVLWGQVDGILATLILISFYYAAKEKITLSVIFLILALNFKLQGIIFVPVLGLLYLQSWVSRFRITNIVWPLIALFVTQLLLLLPFFFVPGAIDKIYNVVFTSVGFYPQVAMNAFNFWELVEEIPYDLMDTDIWIAGITYKTAGLILFAATSFLALLPMFSDVYKAFKDKSSHQMTDRTRIWLTAALVALLFFFFNTQMHERYSHPAFIFLAAYAFFTRDFVPYILFSLAYLLNMEKILKWFQLSSYGTFLFDERFVAGLYLSLIIYLFIKLYQPPRVQEDIKNI